MQGLKSLTATQIKDSLIRVRKGLERQPDSGPFQDSGAASDALTYEMFGAASFQPNATGGQPPTTGSKAAVLAAFSAFTSITNDRLAKNIEDAYNELLKQVKAMNSPKVDYAVLFPSISPRCLPRCCKEKNIYDIKPELQNKFFYDVLIELRNNYFHQIKLRDLDYSNTHSQEIENAKSIASPRLYGLFGVGVGVIGLVVTAAAAYGAYITATATATATAVAAPKMILSFASGGSAGSVDSVS